jgi:GNAT superfamily N-acetyltransferase
LEIERVETRAQLRQFIKVAWTVYANDPNWAPWLYFERLHFLDKRKNPFFQHAEADYFIARRGGRAIGTIAAILNHRHNQFHQENAAHFGIFELLNDPEAAAALLETACGWARRRGADKIIGPMNLSTNDECGMLLEGFHQPPVIMMTYNPPYYLDFMAANGFTKAMDLLAWERELGQANEPDFLPPKLLRVVEKVRQRYNVVIRPIELRQWDAEVARLQTIYNQAWQKNWGFVPMTEAEIRQLADSLKPFLDPALVFVAEVEGQPVGFGLTVPDVNQLLCEIRPGPSLISSYLGAARLIWGKKRAKGVRVIALGVIEAYRRRGVDALLYYETAKAAARQGYTWAEASWILETNDAMNRPIELLGGRVYKKYRLFEKELEKGEVKSEK